MMAGPMVFKSYHISRSLLFTGVITAHGVMRRREDLIVIDFSMS